MLSPLYSKGKESEVAQSCLTLCNPIDCSLPGHSAHGILEWVTISFSRRSSRPRDGTQVSCIADRWSRVTRTGAKFNRDLCLNVPFYKLFFVLNGSVPSCRKGLARDKDYDVANHPPTPSTELPRHSGHGVNAHLLLSASLLVTSTTPHKSLLIIWPLR